MVYIDDNSVSLLWYKGWYRQAGCWIFLYVFSGMNMGLALDVVMKSLGQNLELADANDLIEAAKEGMTVMNGMTSEDDEDF